MPDFHEKITLRPMGADDLDFVVDIEAASFSRPWTRQHFLDEIRSSCGHPTVAVMADGTLVGYLCLKLVLDEAEILDVAVSVAVRGRGIGALLVEDAIARSREHGAQVVALEVRVGNVEAVGLYRRLGFRETGRRKRYYDNGEDAILMTYAIEDQAKE